MKKIIFFLFSVIALSSCVDYGNNPVSNDYFVKINGVKTINNDTFYVAINDVVLMEMFDAQGNKVNAVFYSSNQNSSIGSGTIASIQYPTVGVYRITASLIDGSKTIYVYINVTRSTAYTLKINNLAVASGSTFNATTTQALRFKVTDSYGNVVKTSFDFGDGNKVTTNDSVSIYYANAGNYTLKATTGTKVMTLTMHVTKGSAEAIILISSSISGSTIIAVLGFRCDAIPNFSSVKPTYVAGEIPGYSWNKYDVSEVVTIGGINYFKWNTSVISGGRFRLSWIQLKDGQPVFSYDGSNWAYDTNSIFWNTTDYLFYFYLRINSNNLVVISPS